VSPPSPVSGAPVSGAVDPPSVGVGLLESGGAVGVSVSGGGCVGVLPPALVVGVGFG
jgi:hypothetical protein